MKQRNKNEKPKEKIINFIMNGTEKKLEENEWNIIGLQKWAKVCPNCLKIQEYNTQQGLRIALKNNTLCNRCRYDERKIDIPIEGWSKPCPRCKKIIVYPQKHILKNSIEKNCVCLSCANTLYHRGQRKKKITFDDFSTDSCDKRYIDKIKAL